MNEELDWMQIISNSGDARSLCFEALKLFREGNFSEGLEKQAEAKSRLIDAKKVHGKLLARFASQEQIDINLLVIHAEDHLSSSQVILELLNEFYYLYNKGEGTDEKDPVNM